MKPKIAFIIKERFNHGAIVDTVGALADLFETEFLIEENLSEQNISDINNGNDAIWIRHSLEKKRGRFI